MKIYKDTITNRNEWFEKLVLMTQSEMKKYLIGKLGNYGKVQHGDGYVYHKGTFPVLLCAHMDTVHKDRISTLVYANGTLSSPQGIGGDDRCGIYMILNILKEYDCHVVFLEDEEIGCVGAKKFVKTKACAKLKNCGLKYIIEFDRKDCNHAVTYNCDNKEFDEFITKEFFKKEYGTCSDISYIAPELEVAAVNLSCGYYKEHHIEEWVNLAQMERVIVEAEKILERTKNIKEPFKYIECKRYASSGYGNYYNNRWDDYDDFYNSYGGYGSRYNYSYTKNKKDDKKNFKFRYKGSYGSIISQYIRATKYADAIYNFFTYHPTLKIEDIVEITEE